MNGIKKIALLDASSLADLVAGRESGRGGAVGKICQYGDEMRSIGTLRR